jgi:hypothetical protein
VFALLSVYSVSSFFLPIPIILPFPWLGSHQNQQSQQPRIIFLRVGSQNSQRSEEERQHVVFIER